MMDQNSRQETEATGEQSVDIVMRCYNDMACVQDTLDSIAGQDYPYRLIVMDNESTDGSRELVGRYADRVIDIPKGTYIPGRVLNQAMQATESDIVVFVNSDCTPLDSCWLREMIVAMREEKCAAVFGRQVPRPGCHALYAKDTEDTFGDGRDQARWKHCFSMASSAIRRAVWNQIRFSDDLNYSEDIDWTWRAVQSGHVIRYVAESRVYHSHNYTLRQAYQRQLGEGEAESAIFNWSFWDRNLLRYSILPLLRRILSDWRFCVRHGHLKILMFSPVLRSVQTAGRRRGFRHGFRSRKERECRERKASLKKGMPVL